MTYTTTTYNYGAPAQNSGVTMGFGIFYLAVLIIIIIAGWKIFTKAKKPGWAFIIPIYNIYTMMKIVGRPGWWVILYFIPLVNIVVWIIVSLNLAKSYGRSDAFGIFLLWLFPIIGYLILGFGKSTYKGPAVK